MADRELNIYFDLNVYSRPFDNQSNAKVRQETEAVQSIWEQFKKGGMRLISSDILYFELNNILSASKRSKVADYVKLCDDHVDQNEEILKIALEIEARCKIKPRDALHLASAVYAEVDYCLTCDGRVARKTTNRCLKQVAKMFDKPYIALMDPVRFVEKLFSEG